MGEDADQSIEEVEVDILGVFTLADVRPHFIRAALRRRQHVIAEKPIAASIPEEEALLREIEASDRLVAVNLFNRSAWYHHEIQTFIQQGEIGELAILDISHQTPGAMPDEEHGPEGPPFHDCGMDYIDLARWYANSEIERWDTMGLRIWNWSEPWWGTAHGHFQNGVVFMVTVGFTYGQLAQMQVTQCALEAIGTLGVVRMQHNFDEVVIKYEIPMCESRKDGTNGRWPTNGSMVSPSERAIDIDLSGYVYAYGVTLYEMLTGVLPFTASDPMEWVHCHIARQPKSTDEHVKGLPQAISAIVMKLLSKTPEERYQTAAGIEADLRNCLAAWESVGRIDPFPLGAHDVPDRFLMPERLYGRTRSKCLSVKSKAR